MKQEINHLKVENIDKEDSKQIPVQSANTLFRFFKEFKYLKDVLSHSGLAPRYCEEYVEYLDIPYNIIAYPMICFCDINLHKLKTHTENYGNYGIAFSKDWGENKGIQPIQYVNPNSILCKDFSEAFNHSLTSKGDNILQDYLLTHMNFIKPLKGKMKIGDDIKERIFTDECEWRYVPDSNKLQIPTVLVDQELTTIDIWNEIASKDEYRLHFEYEDIKYIIVEKKSDFFEVCDLLEELNLDKRTMTQVISKVRVWDDERSDF